MVKASALKLLSKLRSFSVCFKAAIYPDKALSDFGARPVSIALAIRPRNCRARLCPASHRLKAFGSFAIKRKASSKVCPLFKMTGAEKSCKIERLKSCLIFARSRVCFLPFNIDKVGSPIGPLSPMACQRIGISWANFLGCPGVGFVDWLNSIWLPFLLTLSSGVPACSYQRINCERFWPDVFSKQARNCSTVAAVPSRLSK